MGAARFSVHCSKSAHWGCGGKAPARVSKHCWVSVRLGQVRLDQVQLGQIRFSQVRLGQVQLGLFQLSQVQLGQVRFSQARLGLVRLGHVGQVKVSCKKIVYDGSYYQLYDFVVTFSFIVWQFHIIYFIGFKLLYSLIVSNFYIVCGFQSIVALNSFNCIAQGCTRGVEGYLMSFHGPTITYPKLFQEVGP